MPRKKYSIRWRKDEPVAFVVNGKKYARIEDIPGTRDRRNLEAMLEATEEQEVERQVKRNLMQDRKAAGRGSLDPEKLILLRFD